MYIISYINIQLQTILREQDINLKEFEDNFLILETKNEHLNIKLLNLTDDHQALKKHNNKILEEKDRLH